MYPRLLLLLVASTLITACAPRAGQDLPPHGETVRHMLEVQTWQPGSETAPRMQGNRAAQTMDVYRAAGAPAPALAPAPR